jgi:histidinol-phosphate aminotransferase
MNARGVRFLSRALRGMGLEVVPSEANFVMLPLATEGDAEWLTRELTARGIIVRPLKAFGLPQCVRISTGTDADNEQCVEAIRSANRAADRGQGLSVNAHSGRGRL